MVTNSIIYDGINDLSLVGPASNLISFGTGEFTVAQWMRSTATSTNNQLVVGYNQLTSLDRYGIGMRASTHPTDPNKIIGVFRDAAQGGTVVVTSNNAEAGINIWTLVFFYREGNTIRIQRNLTVQTDSQDVTGHSMNFDAGDVGFVFGTGDPAFGGQFYTGNLGYGAVWNRLLNVAERTKWFNCALSLGPNLLGPVSSWKHGDDMTFPNIPDTAGGGNTAVMTNMTAGDIVVNAPVDSGCPATPLAGANIPAISGFKNGIEGFANIGGW